MFDDVIYLTRLVVAKMTTCCLNKHILDVFSRRCRVGRVVAFDGATESGLILRPSYGSTLHTDSGLKVARMAGLELKRCSKDKVQISFDMYSYTTGVRSVDDRSYPV
jgi:hypothetical protein